MHRRILTIVGLLLLLTAAAYLGFAVDTPTAYGASGDQRELQVEIRPDPICQKGIDKLYVVVRTDNPNDFDMALFIVDANGPRAYNRLSQIMMGTSGSISGTELRQDLQAASGEQFTVRASFYDECGALLEDLDEVIVVP